VCCSPTLAYSQGQAVYTDSLLNGWEDWGWANINYANTNPVRSGSTSVSVTIINNTWQAIYIHHSPFDSGPYANLTFWIHGGPTGGQQLQVVGHAANATQLSTNLPPLPANTWQQHSIPLTVLGLANRTDVDGIWIQDRIGAAQPTFYLDDIYLSTNSVPPPPLTNSVAINVDAQLDAHPISPLIYGVAFASSSQLADLNATLNRSGGNAETRYNWQIDAHNRGSDWYFISIGDGPGMPGQSADNFVSSSRSGGAEPMLTVPMIGWAPKLGANRAKLPSYSVAKYGPQTATEPGWPDMGNGIGTSTVAKTSWLITTNDPADANFQTNSTFQLAWLRHLTNRWGVSTNGGIRYYFMDNEHTLWHHTHRDVHPNGASRVEIRDKFFDYASKVKEVDPDAIVLGPEEFGWSGYFNSGADLQYGGTYGYGYLPDRATNGGLDYVAWLLSEFHKRHTNTNQRLLDYFTLHRYTEDDAVGGNDVSSETQLKRNRWTRSFWDTNYVDESWIRWQQDNKVMLIPRMKAWVARYYPGTKIGITEYNWGAENHINGATTQADILGIFGREGLDLATRWTTPSASTPTYKAMKMFRNYDGNKSCFGDTSINAGGPNPDNVSVYAALRSSDGALTLMVINKQLSQASAAAVHLSNFESEGRSEVWQLTAANSIVRLDDVNFSGNSFTSTVPAQSITLFVVPPVLVAEQPSNPSPPNGASGVSTNTPLTWTPGINSTGHHLYFGATSNAVANATTNSAEFKGSITEATYSPGPLASSGRFFWRVDELAGAWLTPGPIWTFATAVNSKAVVPLACSLEQDDTLLISFPSHAGQTYRVEKSDNLNPPQWMNVADAISATGSTITLPETSISERTARFYRVVLLPP
jgi:hypothetical protein